MSEKRRDNKGRLLLSGERQRNDGMYEFRYVDAKGIKRSVYSWKLVATDKVPAGKRCKEPLRDIERRIARDLEDGIDATKANQNTLDVFFEDYISTKYEIKQSTKVNYKYLYDRFIRNNLGYKKLADIKYSDMKKFYIKLIIEAGLQPHSIEIIHTILHPIFDIALKDGIVRINPCAGVLKEIKKSHNWSEGKRHALTIPQQEAFINFCANSPRFKHWLNLFTFLLGTGCRIGEAIGLRWCDCDFEKNIISINHNLTYRPQENRKCEFHIGTPKTLSGIRKIPMLSEVKEALLQEYETQQYTGFNESVIDGYSGFIFKSCFGNPISPHIVNRTIMKIVRDYNLQEVENAKIEERSPILLPNFSAHTLRHTFCTRFCENETNIKVIQEIMGHSHISTTMDIYNEATMEKKIESFANFDGKIKVR